MAGSLCVSTISDKFGRKLPLFVCGFFGSLFNFVSSFAPVFWVFALFRAIVGFMIGESRLKMFHVALEVQMGYTRRIGLCLVFVCSGIHAMRRAVSGDNKEPTPRPPALQKKAADLRHKLLLISNCSNTCYCRTLDACYCTYEA